MPRQFKLNDPDWGEYLIFVLHEDGEGRWPSEWRSFQENPVLEPIGKLFSRVSYHAYQDALRNHALPLIQNLGLPPDACLIKTPNDYLRCAHRKTCAMFDRNVCFGDNSSCPTCYQADLGTSEDSIEILVARVFELWRMGFYIVVVPADDI